jgi:hypothetical protein
MPDMHAPLRSPDAMQQRADAVRRQHQAHVQRERRIGNGKTAAIALLAVGLGWTLWNMNQLAAKAASRDTVYAVREANGEWTSSMHYDDVVPAASKEQDVQNVLWTYVQAWDCYGSSSFIRQAYIAQAMSDERVGKQIHAAFLLTNSDAPQHVYGEHGLTVQCELVDPPTPIGENNSQYLFRFNRWVEGGPPGSDTKVLYAATVRYRTGIYPDVDKRRAWLDRVTFNAPGVQVVDYPGAKPQNAQPPRTGARAEIAR